MILLRKFVIRFAPWLLKRHAYRGQVHGYSGWVSVPLLGTVAFIDAYTDDLITEW